MSVSSGDSQSPIARLANERRGRVERALPAYLEMKADRDRREKKPVLKREAFPISLDEELVEGHVAIGYRQFTDCAPTCGNAERTASDFREEVIRDVANVRFVDDDGTPWWKEVEVVIMNDTEAAPEEEKTAPCFIMAAAPDGFIPMNQRGPSAPGDGSRGLEPPALG